MKLIHSLIIIISMIVLTACSDSNDAVIEKVESAEATEMKEPVFIEELDEEEEQIDQFIEFSLEEEQLTINLEKVPILEHFLEGAKNRNEALEQMVMQRLPIENYQIYLLEFSCVNEKCSYIIFNQDERNSAMLLADVSTYSTYYVSPNQQNLMIEFIREQDNVPMSHLIPIDIDEWSRVSLIMSEGDDTIIEYTRPITGVEWINDHEITVQTPHIDDFTPETYRSWNESSEKKYENHQMIIVTPE